MFDFLFDNKQLLSMQTTFMQKIEQIKQGK
jgi:hypothetical protein